MSFILGMKELITLKIECQDPWYSLLANGTKQVEGRKGLVKYHKLKPGDQEKKKKNL